MCGKTTLSQEDYESVYEDGYDQACMDMCDDDLGTTYEEAQGEDESEDSLAEFTWARVEE